MKIFTHPSLYQVVNVQNLLRFKRIKTTIRNEYLAGGSGELAPQDTWPELWLNDETDWARAEELVESLNVENEPWFCTQCGEHNDGSFDYCWQCQTEHKGI